VTSAATRPGLRTPRVGFVAFCLVLAACFVPPCALGEEQPADRSRWRSVVEQTDITGSLRGSYWSSSRSLDKKDDLGVAALWLRGRSQLAPPVALVADGWLMNDDLFAARATRGLLREGYVDLRFGSLDVRAGQQIIAWGRADRINPTDNLTPRDFTLLVPEDSDQRMGTTGLKATYHLGGISLTGVWLPTFQPHVIPLATPRDPFILLPRQLPSEPVSQYAAKIEQTGARIDWSLSFFDGFNLYPDLQVVGRTLTTVSVAQTYHRNQVVGADAATVWGPYGLRAEAAYTFTEHSSSNQVKSPFFFMVMGADRTFLGTLNINLQFVLRVIAAYQNPITVSDPARRAVAIEQATINSQLDRVQESITLRVSNKWLSETLETEVASIVGLTRLDYAVRPKVKYAISDHWRLTVGGDIFGGPDPSFFRRIRDTSTAYVELRWDY
jgi:hypothetical protein